MNLYQFCKDLYKIPRSLTGSGVVQTLEYIQQYIPLQIHHTQSGTKAFDWSIPPEWNIKEAFIKNLNTNEKIVDFKAHNLHIVGYSIPINKVVSFEELDKHLHYLKDQPDAIPYVTSYYSKSWGFCLTYNQYLKIDKSAKFQIFIDSSLDDHGKLSFGEYILEGKSSKEIFFSSYVCHPQMVNNELSGPAVLAGIASNLKNVKPYYTYRFVLVPETIGSIMYLSQNLDHLKGHVVGGYNLTCLGDERSWGLVPSRYGHNISDRIARHVLKANKYNYIEYSWLDRGSDERQYCAPRVDLPISSVTRSKYCEYPEYHTSLDDFNLVTENGLNQSLQFYLDCIEIFENNQHMPLVTTLCEPQLGRRGLYPNTSKRLSGNSARDMMNFISYCDGNNSLLDISDRCNISFNESLSFFKTLKSEGLLSTKINTAECPNHIKLK